MRGICIYLCGCGSLPTPPNSHRYNSIILTKRSSFAVASPDPSPPAVVEREATKLVLSWPPILFCGAQPESMEDFRYILEGVELCENRHNLPPSEDQISAAVYEEICSGVGMLGATVENLNPSCWYQWRVSVEYAGIRFISEEMHVSTTEAVPITPHVMFISSFRSPSAHLIGRTPKLERKVKITWPAPAFVGPSHVSFIIQMHEIYVNIEDREAELKSLMLPKLLKKAQLHHYPTSLKAKQSKQEKEKSLQHEVQDIAVTDITSSHWTTVYTGLDVKAVMPAPRIGALQWNLRLRARNAAGWADDWLTYSINYDTHPELFPVGARVKMHWYNRVPPPTPGLSRLNTQPGRNRPATTSRLLVTADSISVNSWGFHSTSADVSESNDMLEMPSLRSNGSESLIIHKAQKPFSLGDNDRPSTTERSSFVLVPSSSPKSDGGGRKSFNRAAVLPPSGIESFPTVTGGSLTRPKSTPPKTVLRRMQSV